MKTWQKGAKYTPALEGGGLGTHRPRGCGHLGDTGKGTEGRGHAALCLSPLVFIAFIYNIYSNFYSNCKLITSKFDLVLIHIKLGL